MVKVEFLVLGLIKFDKEDAVLSKTQLTEVRDNISQNPKKFTVTGKQEKLGPYWVWPLRSKALGMELTDVERQTKARIFERRLGYYHHRIILQYVVDIRCKKYDDVFESIREIRDCLHDKAKDLFNELLPDKIKEDKKNPKEHPAVKILYIYTYPLIMVHNGKKILKEQIKENTFSIPTTTFFLEVPEQRFLVLLRTHYVRISIPCVWVYGDKNLGKLMRWNLINCIYYSCLYQKKLQDSEIDFENKRYDKDSRQKLYKVDEKILRDLSNDLLKNLAEPEKLKITVDRANTALIAAMLSIILTIILHFL